MLLYYKLLYIHSFFTYVHLSCEIRSKDVFDIWIAEQLLFEESIAPGGRDPDIDSWS